MQISTTIMENSMDIPQRNTVGSSNPTLGVHNQRLRNQHFRRRLHPHVYCSIIHGSQDVKLSTRPSVELEDSTPKRPKIQVVLTTWMDWEAIMGEQSHSQKAEPSFCSSLYFLIFSQLSTPKLLIFIMTAKHQGIIQWYFPSSFLHTSVTDIGHPQACESSMSGDTVFTRRTVMG